MEIFIAALIVILAVVATAFYREEDLKEALERAGSERDDYENLYNVSQSEYIRIREVNSLMHSEAIQLTLELRAIRTISFNRGALLDEKNDVIRALRITIKKYSNSHGLLEDTIAMLAEAEVAALYPKEVNE
jgi:hypothetical protein